VGDRHFQDQVSRLHGAWARSDKSAGRLIDAVGKAASRHDRAGQDGWGVWADQIRCTASLLAPIELARAFSLDQVFFRSDYAERSKLIRRMRSVEPAPPKVARTTHHNRPFDLHAHWTRFHQLQREVMEQPYAGMQMQQMVHMRMREEGFDPDALQNAIRQQQMMMAQQDPWSMAEHVRNSTPLPRSFLPGSQLDHARALVSRQGVDLDSEKAVVLKARNVDEAVLFACLLSKVRRCDLFRGQVVSRWIPTPSIYRKPARRESISARWHSFKDWAGSQPLLSSYNGKQLGAIAQHYGEPTYLLDFTYNPRIAAFFATHAGDSAPDGDAVLFCLSSAGMGAAYHDQPAYQRYYDMSPQVTHVDVDGLFRMQAQEGTFVQCNIENWTDLYVLDRIEFPRGPAVAAPTDADIYPPGLSPVEELVEQFLSAL
jgi:hypothetical protein